MKKCVWQILISIIFCSAFTLNLKAQQLKRYEAVSAYIYNFAKNVQWQNEDAIKEFHFVIIGDDENIIREMTSLSKMKTLRNKPIRVSSASVVSDIDNVQLFFVTKGKEGKLIELFDRIEGKNILLVSDNYPDKRLIMINFIDSEKDNTLHFEINKANITNQHLYILPDMILMGGTAVDVASLYREGQKSLRKLQKQLEDLEQNLSRLEKITADKSTEINIQKDSLNKQSDKIQEQQSILDLQYKKVQEQQRVFDKQSAELNIQSLNLKQQDDAIKKGNVLLTEQKTKLESQNSEILAQSKLVQQKGSQIQKQQNLMYLLVVIVLLALFLIIAIYYGYKSKQKLNKELENKVAVRTHELNDAYSQLLTELSEREKAETKLRQSEEQFRLISENVADMIAVLDLDGKRTYSSPSYKHILGDVNSLSGTDAFGEIIPDDREMIKDMFHSIINTGKDKRSEYRIIASDGSIHFIESQGSVIRNEWDVITNVVFVSRDITERKYSEEKLQQYYEILEEKVRERTGQLKIEKERAESSDRTKSAFLATMSHELRTPLNSIIGFTGILLKGIAGPLNSEQSKQLTMAKRSAQHLLDLINDVLDISKIEAGELVVSKKNFDFNNVLQKVISTIQPLAENKKLKLCLDISNNVGEICSDERRVSQILLNLVNNAVKFTEYGVIKINSVRKENNIITKVIDSGIGISIKDMEKLFKPFSQVDTGITRNHEGTGLGLSISKKLAEKLDGNISVVSEIGVGSTFTLTLPVEENEKVFN